MKVFVTGASGFIGSAVVLELLSAGHEVTGLARSDAAAHALAQAGANVRRGSLEEPETLRAAAADSDGVIHLAFNHDFSRFEANCEDDRRTIGVLAAALEGTSRRLIVTGGLGVISQSGTAIEYDRVVPSSESPRGASEEAALEAAARGINVCVMRLPQVHDRSRQGLVTYLIDLALAKGVSAYVGEGSNRWAAVHRLDAARLYRLVFENGVAGTRYHAVAEEGVTLRAIAEAIGKRFTLPVRSIPPDEAVEHFGMMARFASASLAASSALTQQWVAWTPQHAGLIPDLEHARDASTSSTWATA